MVGNSESVMSPEKTIAMIAIALCIALIVFSRWDEDNDQDDNFGGFI